MYKTVLSRVLDSNLQYPLSCFSTLTLVKLPRSSIMVYRGDLTQEQFESLKCDAAFVLLEIDPGAQLPKITKVVRPAMDSNYKNAV